MATEMKPPAAAQEFLEKAGWKGARIVPVAGDASFRRYFRAIKGDDEAILMDAPPPHEDPKPFIEMARYLRDLGFYAPEIMAEDLDEGLVLLEDFGDHRMREHLDNKPADEEKVYRQTIELIRDLHTKPPAQLPDYDWGQYLREVNLLTEWYCPAVGVDADINGFINAWKIVLQPVLAAQDDPVTVMRDYHAENIMLLDNDRLGLLDFQDALLGHRAYDLVSMLQDARRDVSDELEETMLRHYLSDYTDREAKEFRSHYAVLGAQRNTKIIGIFTRLFVRDGKDRYLDFLPRMWGLLEKDLRHSDLEPVANWFEKNIPHEVRERTIQENAG